MRGEEGAVAPRQGHNGHGAARPLPDRVRKPAVLVEEQALVLLLGGDEEVRLSPILYLRHAVAERELGYGALFNPHRPHPYSMERNGMSEEEAHRYLQKTSMEGGRNMTETAQMVLSVMDH